MTAAGADHLRKKLFVSQGEFRMIKRRLGLRALESLKIDGLTDLLQGSVAVVFAGEDALRLEVNEMAEQSAPHFSSLILGCLERL